VSFCMYGIDKRRALRDKWRIPESRLLWMSVFGVFGALVGMAVFHHKTRKKKFSIGVPLILVAEILLVCLGGWLYVKNPSEAVDVEQYLPSGYTDAETGASGNVDAENIGEVTVSESEDVWYFDGYGPRCSCDLR